MVSDTLNCEYLLTTIVPVLNNPLCTETAQVSMLMDCTDTLSAYRDTASPGHVIQFLSLHLSNISFQIKGTVEIFNINGY